MSDLEKEYELEMEDVEQPSEREASRRFGKGIRA